MSEHLYWNAQCTVGSDENFQIPSKKFFFEISGPGPSYTSLGTSQDHIWSYFENMCRGAQMQWGGAGENGLFLGISIQIFSIPLTGLQMVNAGYRQCFLNQNFMKFLNLESDLRYRQFKMALFRIFSHFFVIFCSRTPKSCQKFMMPSSARHVTPAKWKSTKSWLI